MGRPGVPFADTPPANAKFAAGETVVPFDRSAVAAYLRTQGFDFDAGEPIRQFAGGLANRNYWVRINGKPAVLRRPPDGDLPPGSHDMAREHRLLSGLSRVLPIAPASLHFCPDRSVIGVPFQILEYRPGVIYAGSKLPPEAPTDAPPRLSALLIETLAAIHTVDLARCNLSTLGRPEGFVARAIEGWRARGARIANGRCVGLIKEIAAWLAVQKWQERRPTLLHMDFKLDNLLLDPSSLRVHAVLDWDMGTRGDPLFDLAVLLSYWCEPGEEDIFGELDQMPTALPGFWSRAQAAAEYARLTGMEIADLPALRVLALLRLGVVFLQLHAQFTCGAVRNPRYASFGQCAQKILLHALTCSRRADL
jgi:aminoglycoside phosphotransferase (APT) family kinase protein